MPLYFDWSGSGAPEGIGYTYGLFSSGPMMMSGQF